VSELPSSEDLDPSTGTDAPTPPTTTGPSSYTLNWEEPVKAHPGSPLGSALTVLQEKHRLYEAHRRSEWEAGLNGRAS
jgi:hypothetical protein